MNDPIVAEVRKFRLEHTRKFGGNLAAICADLRKIQVASGLKVARRRSRGLGAMAARRLSGRSTPQ